VRDRLQTGHDFSNSRFLDSGRRCRAKELALLARDLHRGTPGAYEKLAAFANKNISSVWGQRAALALGYDDYSKSHAQQALNWLQKAKADTLLYEYTLFWTAQSERALGKNAAAAQDFAQS